MEENQRLKKNINCKNKDCKNNKNEKCTILTEDDLMNYRSCEERDF